MDVKTLESLVQQSSIPCTSQEQLEMQQRAVHTIELIRCSEASGEMGLSLFFHSTDEVVRFTGLSLMREYLKRCPFTDAYIDQIVKIRDDIYGWMQNSVQCQAAMPSYVKNNMISVLTLLIRHLYKANHWETAFIDLMQLGSCSASSSNAVNILGLELVLGIFDEVTVEVIEFNENRTKEEVTRNCEVKDYMRVTNVLCNIVDYLCKNAISYRSVNDGDLSDRCLRCLAQFIGWIDVKLIVNEAVLSVVYSSLQDRALYGAGCECLYELAKKGMDSISKIRMIDSISLIEKLKDIKIDETKAAGFDDDGCDDDVAQLVDVILLELLECWSIYEEATFSSDSNKNSTIAEICSVAPRAATLLHDVIPIALKLFAFPDVDVSSKMIPSFNKLLVLMKHQYSLEYSNQPPVAAKYQEVKATGYFLSNIYLHALLKCIYIQLKYPDDFSFDGIDEGDEECEVIEIKNNIKKLYVHVCKVFPRDCLELIQLAFTSMSQPFSHVPYSQIEPALKILYCFSEGCGNTHSKYVNEGVFPSIVLALHNTDIVMHRHPQVILLYYEISVRYLRFMDLPMIVKVVSCMVGAQGLRNQNLQLRCRTAYLLYKMNEEMQGRASLLLPVVGTFADLIIGTRTPLSIVTDGARAQAKERPILNQSAEIHLLEAVGLMTSSVFEVSDADRVNQKQMLNEILTILMQQINSVIQYPNQALIQEHMEELADVLAYKIYGISSLIKEYSAKHHPEYVSMFESVAAITIDVCKMFGQYESIRLRGTMFFHRMVKGAAIRSLDSIQVAFPILLRCADCKDVEQVVQLLNQCMIEFTDKALPLIDHLLLTVIQKFESLIQSFEDANKYGSGAKEPPHIEYERLAIQKYYYVFLQHIPTYNCSAIFYSNNNGAYIDSIFNVILSGIVGGRGAIGAITGVPLRKSAIVTLTNLAKVWLDPSHNVHVPSMVVEAFVRFIYDKALPAAFLALNVLDKTDASITVYISELANLLWTVVVVFKKNETCQYLQSVNLGVSPTQLSSIIQLIYASLPTQQQAFRDHFKKIIKN